jgi:hypothetical protein
MLSLVLTSSIAVVVESRSWLSLERASVSIVVQSWSPRAGTSRFLIMKPGGTMKANGAIGPENLRDHDHDHGAWPLP